MKRLVFGIVLTGMVFGASLHAVIEQKAQVVVPHTVTPVKKKAGGFKAWTKKAAGWFKKQAKKAKKSIDKALDKAVSVADKGWENVRKMARGFGKAVTWPIKKKVLQHPSVQNNPYKDRVARVRVGANPVSAGEAAYVTKRKKKTRAALERFIGITIPQGVPTPEIMLSLSGGGSRAMMCAYSFLHALEKVGLLGAVTHIAGLSGSTWTIFPWMVSRMPFDAFRERVLSIVQHGPVLRYKRDVANAASYMLRSLVFGRPITPVTFYGIGLASTLFYDLGANNDPMQVYMDRVLPDDASFPYPMMTTLSGPDMRTITITPHEFGSAVLGAYAPVWAVGRRFKNGMSTGKPPFPDQLSVPIFVSMSSAAIAISFKDVYVNMFEGMKEGIPKKMLRSFLTGPLGRVRVVFSEHLNPFHRMPGLPLYKEERKQAWGKPVSVELTDVGVWRGNPLIALGERIRQGVPTVILTMDASSDVGEAELQKVKNYADGDNPAGMRFPFPDVRGMGTKVTEFRQAGNLLFGYMPRIIDQALKERYQNDPQLGKYATLLNYDINKEAGMGGRREITPTPYVSQRGKSELPKSLWHY